LESFGNDAWVKEDHGPRRRFIAYYRVSTRAQGRSGLGLEPERTGRVEAAAESACDNLRNLAHARSASFQLASKSGL
jgi:hypothetical protein